ncbi:peptidoglycan-binding protein [Pseudonocardia acidicola]|uniref:Helix-turn-helix domain-containing protein n=1 Tax=Pseudonocardia acidicola TaxID=2724939 RepID=A0ABX1S4I9_9PSEU|nr:peptidoglycan-binding protein [Pseudonocardia acidicola]NMH96488.1 helix-turn-helix domain-containing protein [Pseudonocardia acidicola]
MAQWKALPEGLKPQVRELTIRLRQLKDQVGIGTAALARKTAYSRSSWERYLHARTVPPWPAVEALGRLAGADLTRLQVVWELAERAHAPTGPRAPGPETPVDAVTAAEPINASARSQRRGIVWVAASVAVLAALGATVWLVSAGQPRSSARAPVQPAGYACDFSTRDGRLYAGHSSTADRLAVLNSAGEDVVEVQCLLAHHGFDPGRIDGLFGEHTEQAVMALQRAGGAVVDGKVGPHTWALLRT